MQYRPEIDGLRAIAILPVLLFHAGLLSGGYLGVDIFFVISGYLITGIILSDLTKNNFTFGKFYERRARRILPMLLTICLVSTPFAIYLMPSKQLLEFAQSAISVEFFVSNFWFWQKVNYFSSEVNLLPLIHTWSLAVEEQYYLIYPLLMFYLWRYGRKHLLVILVTLGLISLIFAHYFSTLDPAANFYLLPSRVWELTVGAILAYLELNVRRPDNSLKNSIFTCSAFFTLCYCLALFADNTPQPNFITLVPVLATATIIWFSRGNDVIAKLLTTKLLVGIGLISYSMYLWHQPILAFSRLHNFGMLSDYTKLLFIPLTISFSYFTWRYIEAPFRNKATINIKKLAAWLITLASVLLIIASVVIVRQGQSRFSSIPESVQTTFNFATKNILCIPDSGEAKETYCLVGNINKSEPDFIAYGDSHAQSALIGLNTAALKQNKFGIVFHLNSCNPIMDLKITPDITKECDNRNASVYEYVKRHQVKTVIFISRWSFLFTYINKFRATLAPSVNVQKNFRNAQQNFSAVIQKYQKLGVKTVFMQQVPEQLRDPKLVYAAVYDLEPQYRQRTLAAYSLPATSNQQLQHQFLDFIAPIINYKTTILNPSTQFCNTDTCLFGTLNISYYRNKDHVSTAGSALLEPIFLSLLTDKMS